MGEGRNSTLGAMTTPHPLGGNPNLLQPRSQTTCHFAEQPGPNHQEPDRTQHHLEKAPPWPRLPILLVLTRLTLQLTYVSTAPVQGREQTDL